MKRLLLVAALFLAGESSAVTAQVGSWTKSCQTGQNGNTPPAGGFSCYTPASGTATDAASPILAVTTCENFDAFLHDDFDGDGTACTVTWQLQMCPPGATGLATDALKNAACATLPGVAAMTGDDAKTKLGAQFIRVVGGGAGANIDSCRVVVKCAEPSER